MIGPLDPYYLKPPVDHRPPDKLENVEPEFKAFANRKFASRWASALLASADPIMGTHSVEFAAKLLGVDVALIREFNSRHCGWVAQVLMAFPNEVERRRRRFQRKARRLRQRMRRRP